MLLTPQGYLHIGGLRTALFSWLTARHNNGKFLLRVKMRIFLETPKRHLKQLLRHLVGRVEL
ncbi:MAG: hypothetical protein LGB01_01170 [Sulfurovum sp.]|nr:hypothetical protein [Sulfurovum sp.]